MNEKGRGKGSLKKTDDRPDRHRRKPGRSVVMLRKKLRAARERQDSLSRSCRSIDAGQEEEVGFVVADTF